MTTRDEILASYRREQYERAIDRPERFEFVDAHRGPMARLVWQGHEVLCTEWPGTLLSMLKAGVLGSKAMSEAMAIREKNV